MANRAWTATMNDLPLELMVMCLLLLSFRDRIAASRVSRRWRDVVVKSPQFRNKVNFAHAYRRSDAILSALARAGDTLIDATWDDSRHGNNGLDILAANMGRVRTLTFRTNKWSRNGVQLPESLLNTPVPHLEEFFHEGAAQFIIPAHWSGDGAPCLRELNVNTFIFDSACRPFRALRRFRGSTLVRGSQRMDPRTIFRICPTIEDLELHKVDQADVQCLAEGPIPATLTSLSLTRAVDPMDYQRLLTAVQDTIPRLILSAAEDCVVPLQHFAAHARENFRMTVTITRGERKSSSLHVRLACAGPRSLNYDTPGVDTALDRTADLVPHLGALARLEIPTELFDRLLRANATLPALESLTLTVCGARPFGDLNYCHFARRGRVRVPRLRSLTVDSTHAAFSSGAEHWFFGTLPATIRTWLPFGDRTLDEAYFFLSRQAVYPKAVMRMEALRSHVEKVFVGWRGDWEQGFFQEGAWCS